MRLINMIPPFARLSLPSIHSIIRTENRRHSDPSQAKLLRQKVTAFLASFMLIAVMLPGNSQSVHPFEQKADKLISTLYQSPALKKMPSIDQRLVWFSQQSLNKPYMLFPLGEGMAGAFDQQPRYRMDGFDCSTYVSTQLALALSDSPDTFKQCMDKIRYHGNRICFLNRNHFTSLDWNRANQKQGILTDLTTKLVDTDNQPLFHSASTVIDKSSWYQKTADHRIRLFNASRSDMKARAYELKKAGRQYKPVRVDIHYIPTQAFLNKHGHLKQSLLKQIPNGAIMEIVRPNWNLRDKVGTNLHVSHLGFIVWKDDKPYFRNASSTNHRVMDEPLLTYLKKMLKSPTIKGVNIQTIAIQTLDNSPCLAPSLQ